MNSKIKGSLFVLAMFSLTAAKCGDDEPVPAPQSLRSQMKDAASQYAAGVKESTVNFATEYPKTAAATGAGAVLVGVPALSGTARALHNGVIRMAIGTRSGFRLELAAFTAVKNGAMAAATNIAMSIGNLVAEARGYMPVWAAKQEALAQVEWAAVRKRVGPIVTAAWARVPRNAKMAAIPAVVAGTLYYYFK